MRPKERREGGEQDLFRSRLDQIIDLEHALVKLARAIDRQFLEEQLGAVYTDPSGHPPPPPRRLMAGLATPQVHPDYAFYGLSLWVQGKRTAGKSAA
jgi:IS5 family transposase